MSLPLAIESGSRAWGFPSPDSDYDCRFVYIRRAEDYLTPWPRRDVIETPLDGDLDVNGWDLAKALRLLLKGNAVILEWLRSPIAYRGEPGFRDSFLELAERIADRNALQRHYLSMGQRERRLHFGDAQAVAVKKVFYALRPAMVLRWLRRHPEARVPPMHFPQLAAECALPADLAALVAELLARKEVTRELGTAPLPALVGRFVDAEFADTTAFDLRTPQPQPAALAAAETFFRSTLAAYAPTR